jgi:hypothetical protein
MAAALEKTDTRVTRDHLECIKLECESIRTILGMRSDSQCEYGHEDANSNTHTAREAASTITYG